MGRKLPGYPLPTSLWRQFWCEPSPRDLITTKHFQFLDRFGFPPVGSFVECRGLDARGLPKFRVPAGRRPA